MFRQYHIYIWYIYTHHKYTHIYIYVIYLNLPPFAFVHSGIIWGLFNYATVELLLPSPFFTIVLMNSVLYPRSVTKRLWICFTPHVRSFGLLCLSTENPPSQLPLIISKMSFLQGLSYVKLSLMHFQITLKGWKCALIGNIVSLYVLLWQHLDLHITYFFLTHSFRL